MNPNIALCHGDSQTKAVDSQDFISVPTVPVACLFDKRSKFFTDRKDSKLPLHMIGILNR